MSGIARIAAERRRQIEKEGWDATHDEQHRRGELGNAAACYATPPEHRLSLPRCPPLQWPWEEEWWKPTPGNRIRELEKAGALIAAEIDRLLRVAKEEAP